MRLHAEALLSMNFFLLLSFTGASPAKTYLLKNMLQSIKYTLEEYGYAQVIMVIEISENNKDNYR